jgi:thiol-disulfide isomerase/thioredoxin
MKNKIKNSLLSVMVFIVATVTAQVPLTTAVDFTATDVEGHEHNLFQVLDGGQYVLIDFFFTTCGPCQTIAPMVNEAYHYFGCNTADVVFWSIDNGNTDAECIAFDETYGVEYPTISGNEGGGNAICNTYQVSWYPVVILIAPNHDIVEQDIWPITSAQSIIDVLENHGITQNNCAVGIDDLISKNLDINLFPNPATSLLNIEPTTGNKINKIEIVDIVGNVVEKLNQSQMINNTRTTVNLTGLHEGLFFVRVYFENNLIVTKKFNILK